MAQVSNINTHLTAKIVIVGGGIAGIAAASELSKAGVTDFLLLEGRDRLGGRIYTKKHGHGAIDIGAQYIHGVEGNPVYELAVQLDNVVGADSDGGSGSDDSEGDSDAESDDNWHRTNSFYMQDGKWIDSAIVKEVHDLIEEILEECNKFSRQNFPNAAGDSIGTFLHRQFYRYLRTSNDSSEVRRMKESIFNWRLLFEKTENACRSIYEMSLYAWGEYMECEGDSDIELKRGFKPILDEILKPVQPESVLLNTAVKSIYWDTEYCQPPPPRTSATKALSNDFQKLKVGGAEFQETIASNNHDSLKIPSSPICDAIEMKKSANGDWSPAKVIVVTSEGVKVTADHVLVTCPLGYLKKHAHSLFKPLLPNDKLTAIHRMGFGTVDKIFLEFPEPFWDKDCEAIYFAWMPDENFVLNCVENIHYSEYLHHDWYRAIQGFNTVAGHPTLLEGWVAADEAQIMETVPNDVVRDVCHELLQRFTGITGIPKPVSITRSCWYRDPYSWGSYTYIKDGATAEDCDTLAKPLPSQQEPLLLFAGEATHRAYFSTVHGAMLSGQREAKRLLALLGKDDAQGNHTA